MKKQRAANKKLMIRSRIWPISLGRTKCSTETSLFNKWISPFTKIIEGKRWKLFYEHKSPGFVDVVKEFYANMMGMKDKVVYVRGKWISFDKKQIDQTYNLQERKNGSKFKRLVEAPDF